MFIHHLPARISVKRDHRVRPPVRLSLAAAVKDSGAVPGTAALGVVAAADPVVKSFRGGVRERGVALLEG